MEVELHDRDSVHSLRHAPSWLMFSAAAGIINGFAFVTCQHFASHLTGALTHVGLKWIDSVLIAESAAVVAVFLLGAILSPIILRLGVRINPTIGWTVPLVLVAVILIAVTFLGMTGIFDEIEEGTDDSIPPLVLLAILSFAMGLQNATVSATTGLAVRTTHLTGPITDLGINLGTSLVSSGTKRIKALKAAGLRAGQITAFVTGVIASLPLTGILGYPTLLIPAAFILVATYVSFVPAKKPVLANAPA